MRERKRRDGARELLGFAPFAMIPMMALLAVACGGGEPAAERGDKAEAQRGGMSPQARPSSGGNAAALTGPLNFAYCMRTHGVPQFPPPDGDGGFSLDPEATGLDPETPDYQAALRKCGNELSLQSGPGPRPEGMSGPGAQNGGTR